MMFLQEMNNSPNKDLKAQSLYFFLSTLALFLPSVWEKVNILTRIPIFIN